MEYRILSETLEMGQGARIGQGVTIMGPRGGKARRVVIGEGAVLSGGVTLMASEVEIGRGTVIQRGFVAETTGEGEGSIHLGDRVFLGYDGHALTGGLFVGDYTKIHNHTFIHGPGTIHIGHNCWVGGSCILDGQGGLMIGDNVGVGAQSQLWSHIQFGDVLAGCRWHSRKALVVEEDVWFVGHCIVSPIRAHRRSMAMVGSVVTRDMEENHVYAGVPAKDMTDRLGPQFDDPPPEARIERMRGYLDEFYASRRQYGERTMVAVLEYDDRLHGGMTQFHLMDRTYTPQRSSQEMDFLAWVTPSLAKFVPRGWICPSRGPA